MTSKSPVTISDYPINAMSPSQSLSIFYTKSEQIVSEQSDPGVIINPQRARLTRGDFWLHCGWVGVMVRDLKMKELTEDTLVFDVAVGEPPEDWNSCSQKLQGSYPLAEVSSAMLL